VRRAAPPRRLRRGRVLAAPADRGRARVRRCPAGAPATPGVPPGLAEQLPGPAIPRQLPAAVRHFAGRAGELAALTDLAKAAEEIGGTVVICAIHGTAGVGKPNPEN
jgi:hypothetical protein